MARSLFFFLLNFLNDFDDVRKVLVIKGNFLFNIGLLYTTYVFKSFTQKVKLIFDIFFRHLKCIIRDKIAEKTCQVSMHR